jgi:ankyrin repeat protein
MLLDKDRDVAYMKDTKGRTALHIAAQRGNGGVMSYIVSRCPDCCELVDNQGWNLLHVASKIENQFMFDRIIKIILENWSLSNLLNEKNVDGDTPLHFYFNNYETIAKNFVGHPRLDMMAFNKKNLGAWDIAHDHLGKFSEEKVTHNFILHLKKTYIYHYYLFIRFQVAGTSNFSFK